MLNRSPEITRRKQAPWNRLPVERLSGLAADDAVGRAGVLDGRAIAVVCCCAGLKLDNAGGWAVSEVGGGELFGEE